MCKFMVSAKFNLIGNRINGISRINLVRYLEDVNQEIEISWWNQVLLQIFAHHSLMKSY